MKKIIRWHHLLILLAALNSCRTEDEATRDSKVFEKNFQVFTSKKGESVNYPRGYKFLLEKYDSIHATAYTKRTLLKNMHFGKVISEEFVELNIRSQELMMKNDSERWILYPVVKEKEVIGIEVGILKNNETALEFWRMDSKDSYYKDIIDLFRLAYTQKLMNEGMANRGGGCGWNEESPCNTGEVVITVPKPGGPKGDPNLYLPGQGGGGSDPGVIGGGCGVYENCGGGGNPDNPQNQKNPCEKTKSIMSKPSVQDKITELKNQSKTGGEVGIKIKADGTTSGIISGGGHEVELGDAAGYQGGYHNHTPTGIKMFSPPDIIKMLDFSMAQPNGNIADGFMGMFGSEVCSTCPGGYRYYNYIANFSGTAQELADFLYRTKYDFVKLMKDYRKTEKILSENLSYVDYFGADLNSKGLEKLFFDTLKNMGMEGKVNLQKIEDNGTVQNITLDGSGNSTTAIPCP